uniref:Dimer_Tnp_hAT domain-containing protein n=1 Tax=Caenorhabditis japonica TaxID=281687 RepID=A0A8R1DNT6_CAEJA
MLELLQSNTGAVQVLSMPFPLFELQKKYNCSPATSVETERLFSTARTILSENRKRLSRKNFSMLLFLQRNIHLMGY